MSLFAVFVIIGVPLSVLAVAYAGVLVHEHSAPKLADPRASSNVGETPEGQHEKLVSILSPVSEEERLREAKAAVQQVKKAAEDRNFDSFMSAVAEHLRERDHKQRQNAAQSEK